MSEHFFDEETFSNLSLIQNLSPEPNPSKSEIILHDKFLIPGEKKISQSLDRHIILTATHLHIYEVYFSFKLTPKKYIEYRPN